jgi:hypothetical protein
MKLRRINDWTLLVGASMEIRQHGLPLCSGHVDAVTDDGTILWLQPAAQNRRLYEKAEFYEAWATEDRTGFHYRMTQHNADKSHAQCGGCPCRGESGKVVVGSEATCTGTSCRGTWMML